MRIATSTGLATLAVVAVIGATVAPAAPSRTLDTASPLAAGGGRPALRIFVVSRDGVINPRRASPVTVLCLRTTITLAFGFRPTTQIRGKGANLVLQAVLPVVRAGGAVAGVTLRLSNPNGVPVGVRVTATCAEGRNGLSTSRARSARSGAATLGVGPELVQTVVMKGAQVAPGKTVRLAASCPAGPHVVTGDFLFDAGDARLAGVGFLGRTSRPGLEGAFVNDRKQLTSVRFGVLCIQGRGFGLGLDIPGVPGSGAPAAPGGLVRVRSASVTLRTGPGQEPQRIRTVCGDGVHWAGPFFGFPKGVAGSVAERAQLAGAGELAVRVERGSGGAIALSQACLVPIGIDVEDERSSGGGTPGGAGGGARAGWYSGPVGGPGAGAIDLEVVPAGQGQAVSGLQFSTRFTCDEGVTSHHVHVDGTFPVKAGPSFGGSSSSFEIQDVGRRPGTFRIDGSLSSTGWTGAFELSYSSAALGSCTTGSVKWEAFPASGPTHAH